MSNSFFILRRCENRDPYGRILQKEDFYLNRDTYQDALVDVLHCFGFGESYWGKGASVDKECGGYISFNFFLEGNAEILYDHRRLSVAAGNLVIAQFRKNFTLKTGSAGKVRKLCLLLSYTPLQAAICRQIFPEDLTLLELAEPERIHEILNQIYKNIKDIHDENMLICQILLFLQETRRQIYSRSLPDKLLQAIKYITTHLTSGIGRRELTEYLGLSLSSLNRLFVEHLGCSPGQYMILSRLEMAARLLMLPQGNIKQIAYDLGFSSSSFFSREFRKYYGFSPKEFRRRKNFNLTRPVHV